MNINILIAASLLLCAANLASAQTIPQDKALTTGKLTNGFTYYIRHNDEPQKRVQLYLVNKVGSVLEDGDQRGLAHFMEHMNFNGTKHFPKNELVDYLQKAGVRFGADLNAYTSFDETVYELPIPTDDPKMLISGLEIMRDWAQEATLDSVEIEKERGVILEEERLGKGARERISRQFYPMLTNRSRYANRLPIGLDSVLVNFKPAVIKRFYHDWYRPDLQALIVVGDVDVAEVEKVIQAKFSTLKNPPGERKRTDYTIPLTGNNQFLIITDKETPEVLLEIFIKHKAPALNTNADYLALLKRTLFNQLLAARRYAEISQQTNPAFVNMNASNQKLMGGLDMFAFDVTAKKGELQNAFEQTWGFIEKIKRYGFTATELEHAKQNYLRNMKTALEEKNKTPSGSFVTEYQNFFLHNEASPGIEWEYQFANINIGSISLADINSITADYLNGTDLDIMVSAPENERINLPDSANVFAWLNNMSKINIAHFKEDSSNLVLMPIKPQAGKVITTSYLPELNITTYTLGNGIKVVLKPTEFKNDEIRFRGFNPGGTSLYNDAEYDAVSSADGLISRFGLGNLNPVQLSKTLNGKVVNVSATIGPRAEIITGHAAPVDLETALQLVYLQITQPRKDSVLFKNIINGAKETITNRYAEPNNVFTDTINYVLGNYNNRAAPSSIEKLNKIDLQKVYDAYKERFADASGFTFVFVGNFKPDSIKALLEQYLGALPSLNKKEKARDLGMHIPAGEITKKIFRGSENKALVRLVFSGDYEYSPINNLLLNALGEVLQIKLLQHLREEEGEVYSPTVQTTYNKYPKNRYAVIVGFGCAPKNVDHLIEMVQKEMEALKIIGAMEDDVEKFKAAYSKNVELALKDNSFWLSYLSGQYENNEPVLQVFDNKKNLEKITPQSLKQAAPIFFNDKNMIRFILLPEKAFGN